MKMPMVILLFAFVAPAMAAEIDSTPNWDRYVADDLEITALPNGEVVIRLVSRSGLTARQFWVNSVYPRRPMLVFQGRGEPTHSPSAAYSGQKYERRIPPVDQVRNA